MMTVPMLKMLRDYWEELRAGRPAPYRAELDPRKFEGALEHMFIVEQLSATQLRVRLAGMRLSEMMGMEVRGMPPEAFMDARHRDMLSDLVKTALDGPAVVEVDLQAEDDTGWITRGQMLLLPLRSDFGEVTRLMGCIVTDHPVRHVPVNFAITGHRIAEVVASPRPARQAGFAEGQAGFDGPTTAPKLTAIDGNRDVEKQKKSKRSRSHLKIVGDA